MVRRSGYAGSGRRDGGDRAACRRQHVERQANRRRRRRTEDQSRSRLPPLLRLGWQDTVYWAAAPNEGSRMISMPRSGAGAITKSASAAKDDAMPLTRSFRDTVRARAEREPAFRRALFQEAVQALLQGETDHGRPALPAYINGR